MTPHVVAHRSGNSVSGLHAAEPITKTIEVDLHLGADGNLEARHSKRIWLTNRFWERWYLLPPGHHGVQFGSVVAAAHPSTEFWLDVKGANPKLPERVFTELPIDRVRFVSTKSWWLLRRFLDVPGVQTFRSAGNRLELLVLLVRLLFPTGIDGAVVHSRLLSRRVAGRLTRHGLLYTWAANDVGAIVQLAGRGVDGFSVDDLGVVAELEFTGRP